MRCAALLSVCLAVPALAQTITGAPEPSSSAEPSDLVDEPTSLPGSTTVTVSPSQAPRLPTLVGNSTASVPPPTASTTLTLSSLASGAPASSANSTHSISSKAGRPIKPTSVTTETETETDTATSTRRPTAASASPTGGAAPVGMNTVWLGLGFAVALTMVQL